jgi:cytochrome c peroxidase
MFKKIICILLILSIFIAFRSEKMTPAELGKILFFDKILSKNNQTSCASCHQPAFAFADSTAFSLGFQGVRTDRNTPSVMNMASRPYFFYDGRALTLEEQVFHPIRNPNEMNLDITTAVNRLIDNDLYKKYFRNTYQKAPDSTLLADAIAAYIRSLESDGSAPNDEYLNLDKADAMTASQIRGRELFLVKAKCFECHFSPDFTGDEFRNIGIYDGKKYNDAGRFLVTKDSADLGKFKVAGLRNIALTAPYMHNGMFRTLEEVIEYYDNPTKFIKNPINMDTLLQKPLQLTVEEKKDLVNYLHALTDKNLPKK